MKKKRASHIAIGVTCARSYNCVIPGIVIEIWPNFGSFCQKSAVERNPIKRYCSATATVVEQQQLCRIP